MPRYSQIKVEQKHKVAQKERKGLGILYILFQQNLSNKSWI